MMRLMRNASPAIVGALALIFALSGLSFAKTNNSKFPDVKIKNFGQLDDRFYRGARPKDSDYAALAALGVKTVIDLTDNSREYEQPAVERAGLRYINIPMADKSYPSMDQINQFLKVVDDPETGKFFVHCAGGRHRTGVVGAVYRFNHTGWNLDQVLAEMDQFEFGSGYGHGKQKEFVEDYWKQLHAKNTAAVSATSGRNR